MRGARAARAHIMDHRGAIYLASEWVVRLVMLFYVPQRRTAAASRTWLLLIFLLPWPGIILYALFGRIYVSKKRIERQQRASRQIRVAQSQMGPRLPSTPNLPPGLESIVRLASLLGDFEPFAGNRVELLTGYESSLDRLVADIDAAREHGHLLTYIFGDDATGLRVADALARAARRGAVR